MPITKAIVHVSDVPRSVAFYTRFLGGVLVGNQTADGATLNFVTATVELLRTDSTKPPSWREGDLNRGFRHLGFKVSEIDPIVADLRTGGARFWLDPLESTMAGVRITFFFDPDGTIIELVERHLQYEEIHDQAAVDAERALPAPERPRFDHVGLSSDNLAAAEAFYRQLGFVRAGSFDLHNELGTRFDYLRGGSTVLEVFSFAAETQATPVRLDTLGFAAVEFVGQAPGGSRLVGTLADGREVWSDPDDFSFVTTQRSA